MSTQGPTRHAALPPRIKGNDLQAPMLRNGQYLRQYFVVRLPFHGVSRNGKRFMTCRLETVGLSLHAYAWEGECEGFYVPSQGERVYTEGRIRWRGNRFELICRTLQVEDVAGRIRWARHCLRQIMQALAPPSLAEFLVRVFRDRSIGPAFMVAPASLNQHHTFSGGLLVHSAETAWMVYRWSEGSSLLGLCTTAALLHDIGKVRTLCGNHTSTALGKVVRHEDLTLEVLAEHLRWLDNAWPEGGILLRHLLTAQPRLQTPSPAYAALEMVRTADRISAREHVSVLDHQPRLSAL